MKQNMKALSFAVLALAGLTQALSLQAELQQGIDIFNAEPNPIGDDAQGDNDNQGAEVFEDFDDQGENLDSAEGTGSGCHSCKFPFHCKCPHLQDAVVVPPTGTGDVGNGFG